MLKLRSWSIICLLAALLPGCDDDSGQLNPVSGTVTLDGKPVAGAIVAFIPKGAGRPASGVTDQSGAYELTTVFKADGAWADDYSVTIVQYDSAPSVAETSDSPTAASDPYDITNEYPEGYDEMAASSRPASSAKNLLPAEYSNVNSSPLRAQVRAGTDDNVFDFKLKR